MKAAPLLILLLVACGKPATQPANEAEAAALAAKPAVPAVKPFVFDEKTDLLDYHYGWSAEAAAPASSAVRPARSAPTAARAPAVAPRR